MADGMTALLLKAEDKNRWSVTLHHANGWEIALPAATPAEYLIAASEIDYSAYRREIRNLREQHPLLEERLEVSMADFEDFVAEALLLPSMLRDIDPVGYFVLGHLLEQSLRQEDDGAVRCSSSMRGTAASDSGGAHSGSGVLTQRTGDCLRRHGAGHAAGTV